MKNDDVKRIVSALLEEALGRAESAEDAGFLYSVAELVSGLVDYGVHEDYSRETLAENLESSLLEVCKDIGSVKATKYVSEDAIERFYKPFHKGESRAIELALEMLRGSQESGVRSQESGVRSQEEE